MLSRAIRSGMPQNKIQQSNGEEEKRRCGGGRLLLTSMSLSSSSMVDGERGQNAAVCHRTKQNSQIERRGSIGMDGGLCQHHQWGALLLLSTSSLLALMVDGEHRQNRAA